jgi:CheY-like chemotaxis protein
MQRGLSGQAVRSASKIISKDVMPIMSATKILIADDSKTVRTVVAKILGDAGYDVIAASDGIAALELVRGEQPGVAILDIVMPDMDGYAVCERLKNMGSPWSEIPIVFLTSVKSHALEVLGSEYGAYMNKPVNALHLLQTIERQLEKCR